MSQQLKEKKEKHSIARYEPTIHWIWSEHSTVEPPLRSPGPFVQREAQGFDANVQVGDERMKKNSSSLSTKISAKNFLTSKLSNGEKKKIVWKKGKLFGIWKK